MSWICLAPSTEVTLPQLPSAMLAIPVPLVVVDLFDAGIHVVEGYRGSSDRGAAGVYDTPERYCCNCAKHGLTKKAANRNSYAARPNILPIQPPVRGAIQLEPQRASKRLLVDIEE